MGENWDKTSLNITASVLELYNAIYRRNLCVCDIYILSFCRPRNAYSLSRADFGYSKEETFTDYERIWNMVDNDPLGETVEKI